MLQVETPHSPPTVVEESSGRPLFTFSSETASLIKFLSVAVVIPATCRECRTSAGLKLKSDNVEGKNQHSSASNTECENENQPSTSCSNSDSKNLRASDDSDTCGLKTYVDDSHKEADRESQSFKESSKTNSTEMHNINSPSHNTKESKIQLVSEDDTKVENSDDSDSSSTIQPKKIKKDCSDNSAINLPGEHSAPCGACSENENVAISSSDCHLNVNNNQRTVPDSISCNNCIQMREKSEVSKNLIFVTGEFAVALHQLGFKNVPSISESSSRGRILSDSNAGDDGYMVVNYSNNDIHIVQRQDRTDKPDSLIDLFGHVTGLCLSDDQR